MIMNVEKKDTVTFYLKMLQTLFNYSMRRISKDIGVSVDSLYYITGDNKPSEKTNVYLMYKLRQTYPNEMSYIDSAAVAISENVKERINNANI